MIKGSMQEEDITIANIYAPQIGAPQYLRQMLTAIKRKLESNTIIVGDFKTPLKPMERSSKQKINKKTQALSDTLDQMDLIDIYRTFHPKTTEYTFFLSIHGTFSRIDNILGHKLRNTDTAEIQRIMRDYYKQLYANKMDNLKELDKFLEKHNLPRLNQKK